MVTNRTLAHSIAAIAAIVSVVSLSALSGAQTTMAIWMADLTEQAAADHGCKIKFVSNVVEKPVDGQQTILAKVHCEDGRAFDVFRPNAFNDFRFNECDSRTRSSC